MKRLISLGFMAFACLTMQAQSKNVVIELAKSSGVWAPRPAIETFDEKTKMKIVMWGRTEKNDWYKQSKVIKDVPTIDNLGALFPDIANLSKDLPYSPMPWRLTEENNETVLHCYLSMPADIIDSFWLTDEEGAILDKETGITYRARRTEPECYRQMFAVQAKEGAVLDFKIYFPQLPETTRDIAIYGVPNWYLRGMDATILRHPENSYVVHGVINYYDSIPKFKHATLVSEAKNYNKDDFNTWAEYKNPHYIKPVKENTMAMWLTPEATYLAISTEINWNKEFFGRGEGVILIDQSGHQYKCKDVIDYPKGPMFWVQGMSGYYFAIVLVFEPLPLTLETITYIVPEGEPFKANFADWSGEVKPNLNIKELRANQKLFEYHPRVVVE